MKSLSKFEKSLLDLREALGHSKRALEEHIIFAGIAKCFEVCLEYSWKELKRRLDEEGVADAYSPKEIIKASGKINLIDDVETWLLCLNARNFAVHDYLGITKEEYIAVIRRFLLLAEKLSRK